MAQQVEYLVQMDIEILGYVSDETKRFAKFIERMEAKREKKFNNKTIN